MRERRISGPDRDWLTLEQCAEYLGVPPSILEAEQKRGRFPPGVEVSPKNLRYGWLDCVAFAHLRMRLPGQMPPDKAETATG